MTAKGSLLKHEMEAVSHRGSNFAWSAYPICYSARMQQQRGGGRRSRKYQSQLGARRRTNAARMAPEKNAGAENPA
jgi:hypothetical protein